MNQSFFKEILEQEIHSVFLNPAEFGESVTLEGRTLDAVVDTTPANAWALWAKAAAAKARWPKPSSASTTRTRAPYCWTAWILPR